MYHTKEIVYPNETWGSYNYNIHCNFWKCYVQKMVRSAILVFSLFLTRRLSPFTNQLSMYLTWDTGYVHEAKARNPQGDFNLI